MNENRRPKYACEDILEGTRRERALELLVATCNQPLTLFITEAWITPRLERLRSLLSDPITGEQARALRDAAMKRMRLDNLIEWLNLEAMPLADYVRLAEQIAADLKEAEENRKQRRRNLSQSEGTPGGWQNPYLRMLAQAVCQRPPQLDNTGEVTRKRVAHLNQRARIPGQ